MNEAAIIMRKEIHYRSDAVEAGLRECGYKIGKEKPRPDPDDILVIWNRYGYGDSCARAYEGHGAKVVVLENGYLGREWNGQIWYAMSLGRHNGGGTWNVGGSERGRAMFEEHVKPWRDGGEYALVLAQRGIGSPPVAQPRTWQFGARDRLAADGIKVVLRGHPGKHQENATLQQQLDKALFAVTWASGAAIKAIFHGVPVYYGFNSWIGGAAAVPFSTPLKPVFKGDRWPMLESLAWAMWTIEEISNGTAFDHLLR